MTNRDWSLRVGETTHGRICRFRRFCKTVAGLSDHARASLFPGEAARVGRIVDFANGTRSVGVSKLYAWWTVRPHDEYFENVIQRTAR